MIELVLAAAAQQATGIPAEVWIAIIGAISGSLIKPIFDLISQRITAGRESDVEEQERRKAEKQKLMDEIDGLKDELKEIKDIAARDVLESRRREDEWREKYYAVMERFNAVYAEAVPVPTNRLDLSDPEILKEVIRQITNK